MTDNINFERYNRNIIIENLGIDGQKKLLNARVLVAGNGGLGSTVIATLSSLGIGHIGLVDNDVIELSNLNRQFIHKFDGVGRLKTESAQEWIKNYNPDTEVKTYNIRLNQDNCKDIFAQYDIVIDCFDSFESKFILNHACNNFNIPLIHGGVSEYFGQVMVIIPSKSACLECIFPDSERPSVLKGVVSPAVSTIASIQSMETLKIILGIGEPLINTLLSYNGLKQEYKKIKIPQNTSCPVCG